MGLKLSYTWDALNRLTQISFPDSTTILNKYTNGSGSKILGETGFTELRNSGLRLTSMPMVDRSQQHSKWPSLKPLYTFVFNQPTTRWDPLGLDSPGCDATLPKSPAVLECCAIHDECYRQNHCTSRSWWTCVFRWSWPCAGCNANVTSCLIDAPNPQIRGTIPIGPIFIVRNVEYISMFRSTT
jgi:hypothetical protein